MSEHYDAIIIGAGMSGLACGIRLAMYDKKVCILERHTIAGGLNSYYQRRNETLGGVRKFDVGLHALTNFVKKGEKAKPFTKLLKQLRLRYEDFKLCEQTYSKVKFRDTELEFSNDFNHLKADIEKKFPNHYQEFLNLVEHIEKFNELDLSLEYSSAKKVLESYLTNELLVEMLICPLLIYGSAWEDDMDFAQFVIMFKSLYFEGFSRPEGGVRTIIELLVNRFKECGGELKFRSGVNEILTHDGKAIGVKLDNGSEIKSSQIFSSMGYPETVNTLSDKSLYEVKPRVGPMTFMETILVFDKKIPLSLNDSTIVFYNDSNHYQYKSAKNFYDTRSAVICFPDNYEKDIRDGEGTVRVTFMANYEDWAKLEKTDYKEKKEEVFKTAYNLVAKIIPDFDGTLRFHDVFSPTTVKRYTWHERGTVYGSTDKTRDGKTLVDGLYIMGTDQGFLGIVGSILSGISMANLHGLMGE